MSKLIEVRRFNAKGLDAFVTLVREKADNTLNLVDQILNDDEFTELVTSKEGKPVEIEIQWLARRYEFAQHLWKWFGHGNPLSHVSGDTALWDWISAAWLRNFVDNSDKALYKVMGKQQERLILSGSSYLYYHRHLVSGPFFALEANHEQQKNAMCLLATSVIAPGELVERIAGKRKLSIGSVCHLATLLYFDPNRNELREGHTSAPGNPKAFSYYFGQLDVNVDYLGMSVDALLELLPVNFKRWVELAKLDRAV